MQSPFPEKIQKDRRSLSGEGNPTKTAQIVKDTLITPTISKHLLFNDKFRYHSMDLGWVTLW